MRLQPLESQRVAGLKRNECGEGDLSTPIAFTKSVDRVQLGKEMCQPRGKAVGGQSSEVLLLP